MRSWAFCADVDAQAAEASGLKTGGRERARQCACLSAVSTNLIYRAETPERQATRETPERHQRDV